MLAIAFANILLCYFSELTGFSIVSNVVLIYSGTLFLSSMTQISIAIKVLLLLTYIFLCYSSELMQWFK